MGLWLCEIVLIYHFLTVKWSLVDNVCRSTVIIKKPEIGARMNKKWTIKIKPLTKSVRSSVEVRCDRNQTMKPSEHIPRHKLLGPWKFSICDTPPENTYWTHILVILFWCKRSTFQKHQLWWARTKVGNPLGCERFGSSRFVFIGFIPGLREASPIAQRSGTRVSRSTVEFFRVQSRREEKDALIAVVFVLYRYLESNISTPLLAVSL